MSTTPAQNAQEAPSAEHAVVALDVAGTAASAGHRVSSASSYDSDDAAAQTVSPLTSSKQGALSWLRVATIRAPLQMAIALGCACIVATAPKSSAAFNFKGEWITITVALALESTVGATKRKAALRALGTALGGVLGSGVVAFTIAVAQTTTAKVAIMSTLLGISAGIVQAVRAKDVSRDYAFIMMLTTLALTSVTGFRADTVASALQLIAWRMASIACGGLIAFGVSALVLPEFASDAARDTLASILSNASALLCAAIGEYTHSDSHGCVTGAAKGDLYAKHADLHSLEAVTAKSLEKFTLLLNQAREETELPPLLRSVSPLPVDAFARAGAAARSVFTGAVALLHSMESGLTQCALCHSHRACIREAQTALATCYADVARLARRAAQPEEVHASLSALEAAVERLAKDVSREANWASAVHGHKDDSPNTVDASLLRHNVHALGAVCFSMGDAARQAAAIVHAIEPEAAHQLGVAPSESGKVLAVPSQRSFMMLHAPGGGILAAGGSHMTAALRGAAHALDVALHSHMTVHLHRSKSVSAVGAEDSRLHT
jgi:Aluminium activated malate transporter